MKKVISFLCIAALLICSLTACSGTVRSENAQSGTDYFGQTLTGKVVAVDGTLVAVWLGESSDNAGGGESMQMPADDESGPANISSAEGGENPAGQAGG